MIKAIVGRGEAGEEEGQSVREEGAEGGRSKRRLKERGRLDSLTRPVLRHLGSSDGGEEREEEEERGGEHGGRVGREEAKGEEVDVGGLRREVAVTTDEVDFRLLLAAFSFSSVEYVLFVRTCASQPSAATVFFLRLFFFGATFFVSATTDASSPSPFSPSNPSPTPSTCSSIGDVGGDDNAPTEPPSPPLPLELLPLPPPPPNVTLLTTLPFPFAPPPAGSSASNS